MATSNDLKVVYAVPEDIDALMELQFAASEGDDFHRSIWGDNTTANRKAAAGRLLQKWKENHDSMHVLKCLDATSDKLMAMCIWEAKPATSTREEFLEEDCMNNCNWLEGRERKIARAYLIDSLAEEWNVMRGAPHLHLTNLCTSLDARKRGAATMLIRWGLKLSAQLNIPAYCEVSDMSHMLYLKLGFREVSMIHSFLDEEPFSTCPVVVWYPEEHKDE